MTPEELKDLLRHEPFEPFRIRLTSGDAYDVRDPNTVALGKHRMFIAFAERDIDRWVSIGYLHIAAIESLQAA